MRTNCGVVAVRVDGVGGAGADASVQGQSLRQVSRVEPVRAGPADENAPKRSLFRDGRSDSELLSDAVERLERTALVFDYNLRFRIHEDTHRVIVQVLDRESGEVINEIPPEKLLDLIAEIWRLVGLLVDEKV
ncbi:MAG: Flagellar protein FlaG protein [Clostridia bacterium 62_21]|nr:MAG: Flagellar protein FlaG protein [Clostridia bacterium 62_21]